MTGGQLDVLQAVWTCRGLRAPTFMRVLGAVYDGHPYAVVAPEWANDNPLGPITNQNRVSRDLSHLVDGGLVRATAEPGSGDETGVLEYRVTRRGEALLIIAGCAPEHDPPKDLDEKGRL